MLDSHHYFVWLGLGPHNVNSKHWATDCHDWPRLPTGQLTATTGRDWATACHYWPRLATGLLPATTGHDWPLGYLLPAATELCRRLG